MGRIYDENNHMENPMGNESGTWKIPWEKSMGKHLGESHPGPLGGRTTAAAGGGSCVCLGSQQPALPSTLY